MLPLEHSAILLTCIKRVLVLKPNFRSFESDRLHRFYTGFTAIDYTDRTTASASPSPYIYQWGKTFYFILSSIINAYQKQIKVISITGEMI